MPKRSAKEKRRDIVSNKIGPCSLVGRAAVSAETRNLQVAGSIPAKGFYIYLKTKTFI